MAEIRTASFQRELGGIDHISQKLHIATTSKCVRELLLTAAPTPLMIPSHDYGGIFNNVEAPRRLSRWFREKKGAWSLRPIKPGGVGAGVIP